MQEEILWFQKSWSKWLQLGDSNTKFFHGTTIIKRRRHKVNMIQNDDGMRISDSDLLKEHVIEFYKNLFSGGSQLYLQMGAFKALGPDNFQLCNHSFEQLSFSSSIFVRGDSGPHENTGMQGGSFYLLYSFLFTL